LQLLDVKVDESEELFGDCFVGLRLIASPISPNGTLALVTIFLSTQLST
jgi:hypothetical protein